MAERVGFEPTLEFPLNTLSKRAPSATRPSLRLSGKIVGKVFDDAEYYSRGSKTADTLNCMVIFGRSQLPFLPHLRQVFQAVEKGWPVGG